jgi:hypothetical protein
MRAGHRGCEQQLTPVGASRLCVNQIKKNQQTAKNQSTPLVPDVGALDDCFAKKKVLVQPKNYQFIETLTASLADY